MEEEAKSEVWALADLMHGHGGHGNERRAPNMILSPEVIGEISTEGAPRVAAATKVMATPPLAGWLSV
jgi:hypothetical protein